MKGLHPDGDGDGVGLGAHRIGEGRSWLCAFVAELA